MGNNESIFKLLDNIPTVGMLYTIPRSVLNAALGLNNQAVIMAQDLFGDIMIDGTSIITSARMSNPLVASIVPSVASPLLVIIAENIKSDIISSLLITKTAETDKIVLGIVNHIISKTIDISISCVILIYNPNDIVKANANKIASYITYHSSALHYTGKFSYAPYASNENMFVTFPHGLGSRKPVWISSTFTVDGANVPKRIIKSTLELEEYTNHSDSPRFKTTKQYYWYDGEINLANKTIQMTMRFKSDNQVASNIKLDLEHIVMPIF